MTQNDDRTPALRGAAQLYRIVVGTDLSDTGDHAASLGVHLEFVPRNSHISCLI